jgi:hypothetical protein
MGTVDVFVCLLFQLMLFGLMKAVDCHVCFKWCFGCVAFLCWLQIGYRMVVGCVVLLVGCWLLCCLFVCFDLVFVACRCGGRAMARPTTLGSRNKTWAIGCSRPLSSSSSTKRAAETKVETVWFA